MPIFFKAKTREGFTLKVLIELLQNNLRTAFFTADRNGITLRMMDDNRIILVDLNLEAKNFTLYRFMPPDRPPLHMNVNLTHLYDIVRSIKKCDSLQFFVDDSPGKENDLGIKIKSDRNGTHGTSSAIKILPVQHIAMDLPDGYNRSINIPSGEFQKLCKGLTRISTVTKVSSQGFTIKFCSEKEGIIGRTTEFGDADDSDTDEYKDEEVTYDETFDSEQFVRISKIAGLNKTMQVFPSKSRPLMFRSPIGNLGYIAIYIKGKAQIERDALDREVADDMRR
jgi:proliferating cell nuclear antigen PCNA